TARKKTIWQMKSVEIFGYIKSLSKGEKQGLHLTSSPSRKSPLYLKLAEEIHKAENYDPGLLQRRLRINSAQLRKAFEYLFQHAIRSNLFFREKDDPESILAAARHLMSRGCFSLALGEIRRGKELAADREQFLLWMAFLRLEKQASTKDIRKAVNREIKMVRSFLDELDQLERLEERMRARVRVKDMDADLYFEAIQQDLDGFKASSRHAKSVQLVLRRMLATYRERFSLAVAIGEQTVAFLQEHTFLENRDQLLMRELGQIAALSIHLRDKTGIDRWLGQLLALQTDSPAIRLQKLERYCMLRITYAGDTGDVASGQAALNIIEKEIGHFAENLATERFHLLCFFTSWFLYMMGDSEESLKYISRIDLRTKDQPQNDMRGFVRLLELLNRYALGEWDLDNELRSARRYFSQSHRNVKLPFVALSALRDLSRGQLTRQTVLDETVAEIRSLLSEKQEKRANRYMNLQSVFEALAQKQPLWMVIQTNQQTAAKAKGASG
ncbi:MAG: hypothetical protein AAF570_16135, partial [Bacteroidota bacterium]